MGLWFLLPTFAIEDSSSLKYKTSTLPVQLVSIAHEKLRRAHINNNAAKGLFQLQG